jgi:hypothetical protein
VAATGRAVGAAFASGLSAQTGSVRAATARCSAVAVSYGRFRRRTVRPYSGVTTRPASGTTTRPNSGVTYRP